MRMDCFAWTGTKKNDEGIMWIEDEKCICLDSKSCDGCSFYKPKDTVRKRTYKIGQTEVTEWVPR